MNNNRYVKYKTLHGNTQYYLFCFPFAGCGASFYLQWTNFVPQSINLFAVQLPGRENRYTEPPVTDTNVLVPILMESLLPYIDRPLIFYGHSLGGVLAYDLAIQLQEKYNKNLCLFMVSGGRAPDDYGDVQLSGLDEQRLIAILQDLGGLPDEFLGDPAVKNIFLSLIRADIKLLESYNYRYKDGRLACPVMVLHSDNDKLVRNRYLRWEKFCNNTPEMVEFHGDHFFVNKCAKEIIELMTKKIQELG